MRTGRSSTPSSSSQSSPSHTPSGSAESAARIWASDSAWSASKQAVIVVGAVALEQLEETPGRDVIGRVLGKEIALALVPAAQVGQDQVDGVSLRAGGREEPDRRDAQPFLVAVGGRGHVAPGDGAADIGPVREVDGERHQLATEEDRPHRLHVRQMIAAHLGQVEVPHVPVAHPRRRHAIEQRLDREAHHAHVHGNVPALGDQAPPGVGEA